MIGYVGSLAKRLRVICSDTAADTLSLPLSLSVNYRRLNLRRNERLPIGEGRLAHLLNKLEISLKVRKIK